MKIRPLGKITGDLELLLLEMNDSHEMQWGEILNVIHGYLVVHCPGGQEQYTSGGAPVFYYGPPERIKTNE